MYVFFSSRRRHTMCALVTGVQTWALPISANGSASSRPLPRASMFEGRRAPEMERAQELYLATIPETGLGRRGRISLSIAPLRDTARQQHGRASCRERVCQYVEIWVVAVSLKKTKRQTTVTTEHKPN